MRRWIAILWVETTCRRAEDWTWRFAERAERSRGWTGVAWLAGKASDGLHGMAERIQPLQLRMRPKGPL